MIKLLFLLVAVVLVGLAAYSGLHNGFPEPQVMSDTGWLSDQFTHYKHHGDYDVYWSEKTGRVSWEPHSAIVLLPDRAPSWWFYYSSTTPTPSPAPKGVVVKVIEDKACTVTINKNTTMVICSSTRFGRITAEILGGKT